MTRTIVCEEALSLGGLALVIDDEGTRRLYLLEPPASQMLVQSEVGLHAGEPAPTELRFDFHRAALAALLALTDSPPAEPEHILCLGLGGGSLVSWLTLALPSAAIDVCEIHRELFPLACRHFGMPAPRRSPGRGIHAHVGDAIAFLRASCSGTPRLYNVIFVDVSAPSDAHFNAPGSPFLARECLCDMRARCRGVVVLNVLSAPRAPLDSLAALVRLLCEIFCAVWTWPPRPDGNRELSEQALTAESNRLFFCGCSAQAHGAQGAGEHASAARERACAALGRTPAQGLTGMQAVLSILASEESGTPDQGASAPAAAALPSPPPAPRTLRQANRLQRKRPRVLVTHGE